MTLLAYIAKAFVRIYQYGISPILPGACRYSDRFGVFKGTKLGLGRIFRCHPWGGSGYDPVPEENESHPCGCGSEH